MPLTDIKIYYWFKAETDWVCLWILGWNNTCKAGYFERSINNRRVHFLPFNLGLISLKK